MWPRKQEKQLTEEMLTFRKEMSTVINKLIQDLIASAVP